MHRTTTLGDVLITTALVVGIAAVALVLIYLAPG